MKFRTVFCLFALLSPLFAQTPAASSGVVGLTPAPEGAEEAKQTLAPNQKAFLNLPEEKRKEFIEWLGKANRTFQQKRIFETLEQIEKAAAIFKDSPEIYNLRGSCYVEMRAFDKALADFMKAAEFSKDNPSIDFNIAEVYFVTKEWKKSHDMLEKVLKTIPADNLALSRLVEFKMLLCKKRLGKKEEAAALAEKYDFLDDSPFHYYAKAAIAYDDGNTLKAEEWLAMANRIFQDANILAPWQDTMVEFGYIKSFYGNENGEDQ